MSPETDVASQGDTIDEALANLKEALGLYFEEITDAADTPMLPTFLTTVTIYFMPIGGKEAVKILQKAKFYCFPSAWLTRRTH